MRAAVFVPTVAGERFIAALLGLLGEHWRRRCTVVDNGSRDGTAELVERRFPTVRLLRMGRNAGFGAAINRAVSQSDADALVVMNDDVLCPPTTLAGLLGPLADPRVGMVSGVLLQEGSRRVDTAGLACDPSLASQDVLRGTDLRDIDRAGDARPIGPSGGLAVYRRVAFDHVGGFDPGFFAYYEDLDLALRLRAAGWRPAFVPDAHAWHRGSGTVGWRSARKVELVGESRGRILAKYGVLRRPSALPWVGLELLGAGALCLELRSAAPLRARLRGYASCRSRELYPLRESIGCRSLGDAVWQRLARRYGRTA